MAKAFELPPMTLLRRAAVEQTLAGRFAELRRKSDWSARDIKARGGFAARAEALGIDFAQLPAPDIFSPLGLLARISEESQKPNPSTMLAARVLAYQADYPREDGGYPLAYEIALDRLVLARDLAAMSLINEGFGVDLENSATSRTNPTAMFEAERFSTGRTIGLTVAWL